MGGSRATIGTEYPGLRCSSLLWSGLPDFRRPLFQTLVWKPFTNDVQDAKFLLLKVDDGVDFMVCRLYWHLEAFTNSVQTRQTQVII
jgi:hypothetical protein